MTTTAFRALLLSVLAVVSLTSCTDRSTDGFAVVNRSDVEVTVVFVDALEELTVAPGHREVMPMGDCLGTAVLVTAPGQADITLDGSACTGSVLYIEEDHTAGIVSMYA